MRSTLSNGVRLECELVEGARSVAVGVWVRCGGAHDPVGREGAAHMLEHMVFKGTKRRSARDIAMSVESLGGWLDAYTSREHTCYQARVAAAHLDPALDVLADLVLNPKLTARDLQTERRVVLEEIAQVEDTPDDVVYDLHGERLWAGHPYGKPILGSSATVRELALTDIVEAHSRYRGSNLVVAAAGALDPDRFFGQAGSLFGGLPPGRRTSSPRPPRSVRTGTELCVRPTKQSHLVFGSKVPGRSHPDRHALAIVSQALGGGMSSRLFQRVREDLGLCYQVQTFQQFFSAAGLAGIYAGTGSATADAAIEAIRTEMARVAAGELSESEIAAAKEQLKGGLVLSLESTAARLARLASFALHDEPFLDIDELLARIEGVEASDIDRVAAEHFDPDNYLLLRLGPELIPAAAA
ncbi:MAG: insulinase family protein [Gemmatimonadetes bacterium]|nr:insulinase family protein [Gemmatimonadota bacterium]